MRSHQTRLKIFALFGLLGSLAVSCATAPQPKQTQTPVPSTSDSVSSLEIYYRLGRSEHRFEARSTHNQTQASLYTDDDLVKKGQVSQEGYQALASRAAALLEKLKDRAPASQKAAGENNATCRTPYQIRLQVGTDRKTAEGCRDEETGPVLSRLVRDAEFLLYSQK